MITSPRPPLHSSSPLQNTENQKTRTPVRTERQTKVKVVEEDEVGRVGERKVTREGGDEQRMKKL